MRTRLLAFASLLIIASMILGACSPSTATPSAAQPQVTQKVTTVEVMVQGTPIVVTATPEPTAAPKALTSKDPTTLVKTTFGEPETFDPALDYESAGGEVLQNVYETLIFYNREKASEFIPQLASEVPSQENGGISQDGKTYTFKIRPGVKFHNGNDMTPSDVAYSLQRGLLQANTNSPQWLLYEPFFGIGVDDIAVLVEAAQKFGPEAINAPLTADQLGQLPGELYDDVDKMKAVDPAILKTVCERVKAAIVADDTAGTVTMNLSQPWGPLLPTLAASWGSVMDQDWVKKNGGWDGSCDTWQNTYAMRSENDPFTAIANGTGAFKLDHWTPGEEIALSRFDDYWRKEPMWEGGPSGPAKLQHVIIKKVDEWGTRFAMAQAGDTDFLIVNRENTPQIDPFVGETCQYDASNDTFPCSVQSDQPLRLWLGAPQIARTDAFLNFKINTEGGNPFVGSGKLDGNGIPPDFFSDIHVRKAFNYCFDWDTYIKDALVGEAVQSVGITLPGHPGYDPNGSKYTYDPAKCEEEFKASELKAADGKSLWDTGFRMQIAYNTGNTTRQTIAEILAANLSAVNDKFQIEVIGLPWATFLRAQRARTLPMFVVQWAEDIHDPHNWYQPYLVGTYGRNQSLPADAMAEFQDLVSQGVAETDPAKRAEIYTQLNQKVYDLTPDIILAIATQRHYEQRWVDGWYYNPIYFGDYFYPLSKR